MKITETLSGMQENAFYNADAICSYNRLMKLHVVKLYAHTIIIMQVENCAAVDVSVSKELVGYNKILPHSVSHYLT